MGQSNISYGEPPPCSPLDEFNIRAHQDVIDAVDRAEISKAHGELIAVLRPEVQQKAIQGLRQSQLLPGVADLIRSIESLAVPLANAAFDKDECSQCGYNSTSHQGQFKVTIKSGLCVNAECAAEKHKQALEQRKLQLGTKYRVIALQVASSSAVSSDAVGQEQHVECTGRCPKFGAVLTGRPGESIQTQELVCTDIACHAEKIEAHRVSELQNFKTKVWKHAAKKHYLTLNDLQMRGVMIGLLASGWGPGNAVRIALGAAEDQDLQSLLTQYMSAPQDQVMALTKAIVPGLIEAALPHQVGSLLQALGVQLHKHWVFTAKFLDRLSIGEIDAVCKDLRLAQSQGIVDSRATGDRKAYASAVGAVLSKEVCMGYIPSVLRY